MYVNFIYSFVKWTSFLDVSVWRLNTLGIVVVVVVVGVQVLM